MKRQVTALIGRCYAGLDAASLRDEVLRRLRRIMTVDAAFFGTVDPQTLLFTSAVAEEPLRPATSEFLENEYGRADVNKFAALAEAADPVSSLDLATRGQRADSARYREVMGPLGLGDELRAALISANQCRDRRGRLAGRQRAASGRLRRSRTAGPARGGRAAAAVC